MLNVACIVLTILFVPETKNISLENIERNLMNGEALRNIGQTKQPATQERYS